MGKSRLDSKIFSTSFLDWDDLVKTDFSKSSVVIGAEEIDTEIRRTELKSKQEELKGLEQDREQRKDFANKIFVMLVCFLGATMAVVSLSAISRLGFNLSDTVLMTLLATTTANIIAIFMIVVRYLFKSNTCPKCGIKVSSTSEITTNT